MSRFGSFGLPSLALYLTHRGYSVLADHVGRRGTIALSMYSSSVVMLALSQAGGLTEIVPLTALAGLAAESYRPASSAALATSCRTAGA